MVVLRAEVTATANNSLDKDIITTSLVFDYGAERGIIFMEG